MTIVRSAEQPSTSRAESADGRPCVGDPQVDAARAFHERTEAVPPQRQLSRATLSEALVRAEAGPPARRPGSSAPLEERGSES